MNTLDKVVLKRSLKVPSGPVPSSSVQSFYVSKSTPKGSSHIIELKDSVKKVKNSYQVLPSLQTFQGKERVLKTRSRSIKNLQKLTNLPNLYSEYDQSSASVPIQFKKIESPKKRSVSEQNPPYSKVIKDSNRNEEIQLKLSNYLSLDDFRPCNNETSPRKIFEKLKQSKSKVKGLSKWFFGDGTYEWRECIIEAYDDEKETFKIIWPSGKSKHVSRINLRFEHEDEHQYELKIKKARQNLNELEILLRFNAFLGTPESKYGTFTTIFIRKVLEYLQCTPKPTIHYMTGEKQQNLPISLKYNAKRILWKNERTHFVDEFLTAQKMGLTTYEFILGVLTNLPAIKLFRHKALENVKVNSQTLKCFFEEVLKYWLYVQKNLEFLSVNKEVIAETPFNFKLKNDNFLYKDTFSIAPPGTNPSRFFKYFFKFKKNSNLMRPDAIKVSKSVFDIIQSIDSYIFNPLPITKIDLGTLIQILSSESSHFFSKLKNYLIEIHCFLLEILTEEDEKRLKRNELKLKEKVHSQQKVELEDSLPEHILVFTKKLIKVTNLKVEVKIRESLNLSMKILSKKFNSKSLKTKNTPFNSTEPLSSENSMITSNLSINAYDSASHFIKVSLITDWTTCSFIHIPSKSDFESKIFEFAEMNLATLSKIKCLDTFHTGPARSSSFMHILQISSKPHQKYISKLKFNLNFQLNLLSILINKLEPFIYILSLDSDLLYNAHKSISPSETEQEISRFISDYYKLEEILRPSKMAFGVWIVDCEQVKSELFSKLKNSITILSNVLIEIIKNKLSELNSRFEMVYSAIEYVPKTMEEMNEIRTFIKLNFYSEVFYFDTEIKNLFLNLSFLERNFLLVPIHIYSQSWTCVGYISRLEKAKSRILHIIATLIDSFTQQLASNRDKLSKRVAEMFNNFQQLIQENDLSKSETMAENFNALKDLVEKTAQECKLLNSREFILEIEVTNFKLLEKIQRRYTPYCKIWYFIRDFLGNYPYWMSDPIHILKVDTIVLEVNLYLTEIARMEKGQFKDNQSALKLTGDFYSLVKNFEQYLSLIRVFTNQGMKERHWLEVYQKTGFKLSDNKSETLKSLIAYNIKQHTEILESVNELATKELALDNARRSMEVFWQSVYFKFENFKDCYILQNIIEILDIIDDQLIKTETMLSSPNIKFIFNEVSKWKLTMKKIQDILENWQKFQRNWLYLHPIFSSDDIAKQMPSTSNKFLSIEGQWYSLMAAATDNPLCYDFCLNRPKFLESLQRSNDSLEHIMKSLNEYLLSKRKAFSRFYFLSNDELVLLLSCSQDLQAVQKNISKCFEGISSVIIKNKTITAMVSPEGEIVKLSEKINLFKDSNLKGVELWMTDLELQMKKSLKSIFCSALEHKMSDIKSWVSSWPAQVIQTSSQIIWTNQVESALKESNLQACFESLSNNLQSLVAMVRGSLNLQERLTFSTMIVLEVHNKDIVEGLVNSKVQDANDFLWVSCLRHYIFKGLVKVKMLDCIRLYGYEYLGNTTRLVNTKLTERCFLTLMIALHLTLGGAPEGPAGTGKTETVKDLAKSIAMKCIVFNCSDSLDHIYMAKFFTGLCFCGAWVCFDEFNRINMEVLSVVAEQILSIQKSVQTKAGLFNLDNDEVKMDLNVAVFITMNPSYSNRSKLPENLKTLFRSVTMITPEYSVIAEIYLYSYGFMDARVLARKIVNSLKVASEQLSNQAHYDYGMRAVNTIVKAAGWFKQENLNENEEVLIFRAIKAINVPKFVKDDIQLFDGILLDLFGAVNEGKLELFELEPMVLKAFSELFYVPHPEFLRKIQEIFQTIELRHGVMVVGPTQGGKTTALEILSKALGYNSHAEYCYINPKSMSLNQFYGFFDNTAHEWVDGILTSSLRKFTEKTIEGYQWIILDSPVDSVWIESMNTVMDDNKKLCLSSGDIIKLTPSIRIIIEVDHLNNATPATVSRCGMIFLNPEDVLSPNCLINGWISNPPQKMNSPAHKTLFNILFNRIFEPCLILYQQFHKPIKPCLTSIEITKNTIKLFECLIVRKGLSRQQHDFTIIEEDKQQEESLEKVEIGKVKGNLMKKKLVTKVTMDFVEKKVLTPEEMEKDAKRIGNWFLFSVFWGIGGTCNNEFRKVLSEKILELGQELADLPEDMENHFYTEKSEKWVLWKSIIEPPSALGSLSYCFVYTVPLMAYSFIITELLTRKENILISGPTGTGKSFLLNTILQSIEKIYIKSSTLLSGCSNSEEIQKLLYQSLTRRKKSVWGPDIGKFQIFIIDDLSMPAPDKHGSQSSIELIRSIIERKKIIDKVHVQFSSVEDIQFIGCMGKSNKITPRFPPKTVQLHFIDHDSESLTYILTTILTLGTINHPFAIQQSINLISSAIIEIYFKVKNKLPPTPLKSHYTFNFRDLISVVQGITYCGPLKLETTETLFRLWAHECIRVFCDRLIDESDKNVVKNVIKDVVQSLFKLSWDRVLGDEPVFINFLDDRLYEECQNPVKIRKSLEKYLEEYNYANTVKMNLLLFEFAVSHICRISRVLVWNKGHLLLIGIAGSGRLSLTKLSVFFLKMNVYQIKLAKSYSTDEWNEDIKSVLKETGQKLNKIVFILRDNEIIIESFLESINHLLNSGQVPNLFLPEEKNEIISHLQVGKDRMLKSSEEIWQIFVENVQQNLHIVMCMTPKGDTLRLRLQQFPALGNCCIIDWFTEWPEEALSKVADYYLSEQALLESDKIQTLKPIFLSFHLSVRSLSALYSQELKRFTYVTPAQFILLMKNFTDILKSKEDYLIKMITKYKNGIKYLENTENFVGQLQVDMVELKSGLEKQSEIVEELLQNVNKEKVDASIAKIAVLEERKLCKDQAKFAQETRTECGEALAKVLPELDLATRSLETIKKQDLNILKAMISPPDAVRLTLEAIAMFYNQPPTRVKDPSNPNAIISDYFETGRKMVSVPKFIKDLQNYDKESLTQDIIDRIGPYMQMERFNPEIVKHASNAAEGVCRWIRAIYNFYFINEDVKPKKLALQKAEKDLKDKKLNYKFKKKQLKDLEEYIKILEKRYNKQLVEKNKLINNITILELKLKRAFKLIELLSKEKEQWKVAIEGFETARQQLLGDVLLSSASVTYLGPYNIDYRKQVINQSWILTLSSNPSIYFSAEFSLASAIGDQNTIQSWILCGLPSDSVSIENSLIIYHSYNWPLIVDPQGQALKWLKKSLAQNSVQSFSTKLESLDFMSTLENALLIGASLIIQDIKETIDPVLDSLLTKEWIIKKSSTYIKIGDLLKEVILNFKLIMISNYANPHFSPEIQSKVTLLDFTITEEGLTEQLLYIVCKQELTKETAEKDQLKAQSVEYNKKLLESEKNILNMLQNQTETLLDNEEMIVLLNELKKISVEAIKKLNNCKKAEERILGLQKKYVPAGKKSAILYFCVTSLCNIDHMYQFSMNWFISNFKKGLKSAEKSDKVQERVKNIINKSRELIFNAVCRGLYERDKILFAFIVCIQLQKSDGNIQPWQWKFFVTGICEVSENIEKQVSFISEKSWNEVVQLDKKLTGLVQSLKISDQKWESFKTPQKKFEQIPNFDELTLSLPDPFNKSSLINRLLILKAIKPELLVLSIKSYIKSYLGIKFLYPENLPFSQMLLEATPSHPLLFTLTSGSELRQKIQDLANENEIELISLSLGKGQGVKAENLISLNKEKQNWVLLENCHLASSWLPKLEIILETLTIEHKAGKINKNFKLLLTSAPINAFPISILRKCLKVTSELPTDLNSSLLGIYNGIQEIQEETDFFESSNKPETWKKLFFQLCFFHCVILQRNFYGPIGWNNQYDFSESDLKISAKQIMSMVNRFDYIPFGAVVYLVSECHYGGKVTDDSDKIALSSILSNFVNEGVLIDPFHRLVPVDGYYNPGNKDLQEIIASISEFPQINSAEIYGLHPNAEITRSTFEGSQLSANLQTLQSKVSLGSFEDQKSSLFKIINIILQKLEKKFDVPKARAKFPYDFNKSINVVLIQELTKYNILIDFIISSLETQKKVYEGRILMTPEYEITSESLLKNQIPQTWSKISYLTCKSLLPYIIDLQKRVKFFSDWVDTGQPACFWLPGFYFSQAFLTATLQEYSRNKRVPIDTLKFSVEILDTVPFTAPEFGTYIYGLYLEGASWFEGKLIEAKENELFVEFPVIWLKPSVQGYVLPYVHYNCPIYRTANRAGVISTTGHSSNFLLNIELNCTINENHWVQRGTALLTQTID